MGTATAAHTAASTVDSRALVSLLHFADTAFPTGGYAHSFGLERYCQAGIVTDAAGVERFLVGADRGLGGPGRCHRGGGRGGRHRRARCRCVRTARRHARRDEAGREFREGSRQMGRQTLRIAVSLTGDALLAAYLADVNAGAAPGHHAVAFGMAAGVLGWDAEAAATVPLLGERRSWSAPAAPLPMGQAEGQRVLWRLGPLIARLAREAAGRDPTMWGFAPGLDIQAMRHPHWPRGSSGRDGRGSTLTRTNPRPDYAARSAKEPMVNRPAAR